MAAAAIKRFFTEERVIATLAANGDSDRVIQSLRAKGGDDEIWITDLSWTTTKTAEHLTNLVRNGVRLYWIDHHRTAVSRATAPEFEVPFTGRVLSEEFSAARLAFNYLKDLAAERGEQSRLPEFEKFFPFVAIADDHDRWIHQVPESADWALAVQTLGGVDSFREITKLTEPVMSKRMRIALEAGKRAMNKSLELANTTMVDRPLGNGLTIRTACCLGYSSEVASKLYEGQSSTIVALFDLRSLGVSLRRSTDCDVDLSILAHQFGGGGHAAAAGFAIAEAKRAPAERLAEILGDRLERNS
jgi:oligoribonuclease NrnB/cAMP/cGMP phosphodiesterase (DHH superfamily)